ncbi:hypothetical protein S83_023278, partial [Arachis hypogaea]
EWAQGARAPRNYQEYFNRVHSSARNIIEQCFGLLKKKWSILRSPSFYPLKTISDNYCLLFAAKISFERVWRWIWRRKVAYWMNLCLMETKNRMEWLMWLKTQTSGLTDNFILVTRTSNQVLQSWQAIFSISLARG